MSFLVTRQQAITRKGRSMTLRRLLTTTTKSDVTVQGFVSTFRADQVGVGSVMQGDSQVAILNDEITTAAWPGPPRARDQMVIDAKTWTVQGSVAIYEGETCIGHTIHIRGA